VIRLAVAPVFLLAELSVLSLRARLVNRAISLCTSCALLICTVIVVLFAGAFFEFEIALAIALPFIGSMLALIASLIIFPGEIRQATASLRIGHR
jgi:hypothetical protein